MTMKLHEATAKQPVVAINRQAEVIDLSKYRNKAYIVLPETSEPYVLLPQSQFEDLLAKASLGDLQEESFPLDILDRLENECPIRVFREYRGLTLKELAGMAELSPSCISAYESGKRNPSPKSLRSLSKALRVNINSLAYSDSFVIRHNLNPNQHGMLLSAI